MPRNLPTLGFSRFVRVRAGGQQKAIEMIIDRNRADRHGVCVSRTTNARPTGHPGGDPCRFTTGLHTSHVGSNCPGCLPDGSISRITRATPRHSEARSLAFLRLSQDDHR
eukprot:358968-Chlamydomonas_euryale.AAC.6